MNRLKDGLWSIAKAAVAASALVAVAPGAAKSNGIPQHDMDALAYLLEYDELPATKGVVSQSQQEMMDILAGNASRKVIAAEGDFYRNYLDTSAKVMARLADPEQVKNQTNPNAPGWQTLTPEQKRDMMDYTVNALHEAGGEGLEGMCAVTESVRLRAKNNHQGRGDTPRRQILSLAQYSWVGDENVLPRLTTRTKGNARAWDDAYKSAAMAMLGGREAVQRGMATQAEADACNATLAKIQGAMDYYNPAKASPAWGKTMMATTHRGIRVGNHLFMVPRKSLEKAG